MQCKPSKPKPVTKDPIVRTLAVGRIAEHGMGSVFEMTADLMRPARVRPRLVQPVAFEFPK